MVTKRIIQATFLVAALFATFVAFGETPSTKFPGQSIPEVGDSGPTWGTNLRGYLLSVDEWVGGSGSNYWSRSGTALLPVTADDSVGSATTGMTIYSKGITSTATTSRLNVSNSSNPTGAYLNEHDIYTNTADDTIHFAYDGTNTVCFDLSGASNGHALIYSTTSGCYHPASAGVGDMLQSTYDADTDNLIDLDAGGLDTDMSDPGADRIVGWNDTTNGIAYFTMGTGLNYDDSTNIITTDFINTADGDLDMDDYSIRNAGTISADYFSTTVADGSRAVNPLNSTAYSGTDEGAIWYEADDDVIMVNTSSSTSETIAYISDVGGGGAWVGTATSDLFMDDNDVIYITSHVSMSNTHQHVTANYTDSNAASAVGVFSADGGGGLWYDWNSGVGAYVYSYDGIPATATSGENYLRSALEVRENNVTLIKFVGVGNTIDNLLNVDAQGIDIDAGDTELRVEDAGWIYHVATVGIDYEVPYFQSGGSGSPMDTALNFKSNLAIAPTWALYSGVNASFYASAGQWGYADSGDSWASLDSLAGGGTTYWTRNNAAVWPTNAGDSVGTATTAVGDVYADVLIADEQFTAASTVVMSAVCGTNSWAIIQDAGGLSCVELTGGAEVNNLDATISGGFASGDVIYGDGADSAIYTALNFALIADSITDAQVPDDITILSSAISGDITSAQIAADMARDSELFGGNFSDLAGSITDAQTPDDITINTSALNGTIASTQIDADMARDSELHAKTTSLPFTSITGTATDAQLPAAATFNSVGVTTLTVGGVAAMNSTVTMSAVCGTNSWAIVQGASGLSCVELTGGAEVNNLETTITGIADAELFIGNGADSGTYVAVTSAGGDGGISNTGVLTVDDDEHNHTEATVTLPLNDVANPDANKTFTMGASTLVFSYAAPTGGDGAFEIEATGAFTGDLMHLHQHTGNPGAGTDLVHLEADDADVTPLRIVAASDPAVWVTGNIDLSGEVDGVDIGTDVPLNTTHRTSTGADHTYIDQDVTNGSTPTFTATNITGIVDAALPAAATFNAVTGTTVTVGTSLVISGDTINDLNGSGLEVATNVLGVVSEIYTISKSAQMFTPTATDAGWFHRSIDTGTITEVQCYSWGAATTIVVTNAASDVTDSGGLSCTSGAWVTDATLANTTLSADNALGWEISASTASQVYIQVDFTVP